MDDYCGIPPSESTIAEITGNAITSQVIPLANKFMQSIGGDILACDHTFKCVGGVATTPEATESSFPALFSVMNEFKLVVAYALSKGTTGEERKSVIAELYDRYRRFVPDNWEPLMFTDTCCQDCSWWFGAGFKGKTFLDLFHLIHRITESVNRSSNLFPQFHQKLSNCICGTAKGSAGMCLPANEIKENLALLKVRIFV